MVYSPTFTINSTRNVGKYSSPMDGLGLSIEVALGFIEDVESLENYGPCWAVDQ